MAVVIGAIGFLAEQVAAQGAGATVMDCRRTQNFGYLLYYASGHSAIFNLEVAHDGTGWLVASTYTATATETGTAQIAGFYPYLRVNVTKVYSAAGGSGNLWVHYTPGLPR